MWSLEWCCKLVSKTFFLCCTHLLSICCVPETKTVLRDADKAGTKYAWTNICSEQGFPCGSAGKESTCNEKDLDSIPGLGRSPGEGKGYPLQYSGLENSKEELQRVRHDWVTFIFILCAIITDTKRSRTASEEGEIISVGREGEESRKGKGFTKEMTLLMVCFVGWISRQIKKRHSDKRNSKCKGTEDVDSHDGFGEIQTILLTVYVYVCVCVHLHAHTCVFSGKIHDLLFYVHNSVALSAFALFCNPLKIDGFTSTFFKGIMGNKSGFDLHLEVFQRNSSVVHRKGTHFSLLKLARCLTSLKLSVFFDDIRIVTELAFLSCKS